MPERGPSPDPFTLPPELISAIQDDEYACITLPIEYGTALVAKLPAVEIEGLGGTYPIQMRHELFGHPASPVIRITATLYDQPDSPFLLETFINIADDDQRADYAALAAQEVIPLLFYDELHQRQLAKVVPNSAWAQIPQVLEAAGDLLRDIPPEGRDFDQAKADILAAIQLNQDDQEGK